MHTHTQRTLFYMVTSATHVTVQGSPGGLVDDYKSYMYWHVSTVQE